MEFPEILTNLMLERKITPYRIWKDTNIPQAMIGRWKKGGQTPSIEKLAVLADYFGVTTDFLLGKTENKKSPAEAEGKDAIDDDLIVLARRVGDIPEDDRKRIYKTFESTIDLYLEAIKKDNKK